MELNGWGVAGGIVGFILVSAVNPAGGALMAVFGAVFLGWIANAIGASR